MHNSSAQLEFLESPEALAGPPPFPVALQQGNQTSSGPRREKQKLPSLLRLRHRTGSHLYRSLWAKASDVTSQIQRQEKQNPPG